MIAALSFFRRQPAEPEPIDPAARDTHLDTPTFVRWSGEWRSGLRTVRARTLEWSVASPTKPGWYWCRFVGSTKYEPIRVEAGYEYPAGRVEWAGPLLEPAG